MVTNVQIVGQRIKHYRKLQALTQRELAEEIGVASSYIANIEQGQKGVSLDRLVDICQKFNIGLSDLLPMEDAGALDVREELIGEIAEALRVLDTTQIRFLRTMVCSLRGA